MTELVFFYGTLMSAFNRPSRLRINANLAPEGRGWIPGALFDLGLYAAATPAPDSRVCGEVHRMLNPDVVLAALDEIEGYRVSDPETSLYTRAETTVTFEDGHTANAWVFFYNAPLGGAHRIDSGDYLKYLSAV